MADPDKEGGGGHPDPEIRGGGGDLKIFFSALRASVWAKNKRGPRPLPWTRQCIVWRKLMLVTFGTITVTIQSVVRSSHRLSTHCWF